MEIDRDLINLAIVLIVLVSAIAGPILQWLKKQSAQPGEQPEPAQEEPAPTFEAEVEEAFGPPVKRHRPPPKEAVQEEMTPVPPPAAPRVPQAPAPVQRHPTLDERLLSNRNLSPGVRLIIAAEILGRPKFLRRLNQYRI
ncbi:MAG: hypothetical protein HYY16_16235 [Planctomycetes bacterium]|nr:hypothetical protein [Planctomycetota bacterium]